MSSDRRLTPRGQERRDELLAYATRRFAENGFHPTSVSDIVDGVGVGKGVFYWYFPSKDALLLEILRRSLFDLRRTQQAALETADDPLGRLEQGIRASLRWSWANPDIMTLAQFGWTEDSFAGAMAKGRRVVLADTARHVQNAIEARLIPAGDSVMLATAIHGVIDELARRYRPRAGRRPDEEVVATAVRMCLGGLAGAGPARTTEPSADPRPSDPGPAGGSGADRTEVG